MRVTTLTSSAGPAGYLDADRTVEVPDAFGKYLIEVGTARKADDGAKVNAEWPHARDVPKAESDPAQKGVK